MLDGTFQTGTFQTGRNISNDLHPNVGNRHPIWCSSEFSRCLCALCIKLHLCNLAQSLIPSPHAHTGTLFNAWHSRKHPPHAHTGTVFDPWHSRKPSPHAHTGTVLNAWHSQKITSPHAHTGTFLNAWHSQKQRHPTHTLAYDVPLYLQVDHFVRFADDERQMPVVWHQTLLCFIQRYKDEIRPEDKSALRKLCSAQSHYLVRMCVCVCVCACVCV